MKKTTFYLFALLLFGFSFSGIAQTLNQNAGWPNAAWTVTGTYNADPLAFEADPTTTTNFAFDDDDAGNPSDDDIAAESPVIDLTAAFAAGETWLNVTADYSYNFLADLLTLEYWNADAGAWFIWDTFVDTVAQPQDDFCAAARDAYTSTVLNIASFTATQQSGFKYRIYFQDDAGAGGGAWEWGFCFDAPTISSSTPPDCPDPIALTAGNYMPTSADLSWTETGASGLWDIEFLDVTAGETVMGTPTDMGVTNPFTATGLVAGNDYAFYVRSDCGGAGVSGWTGPFDFTLLVPPPNDTMAGAIPILPSPEGTGCGAATFTLLFATDNTTDSGMNGTCNGVDTGLDQFFTWTATSDALVYNNLAPGNPGIIIRDIAGVEIVCSQTFEAADFVLSGWTLGQDLIIQVYDFAGSLSDVAFCLEQFTLPAAPECATDPNPVDGAIDVPVGAVTFSWTAPAAGVAPTGYNIYAGETPAGNDYGLIATVTDPTVDLNVNAYETLLYWIVVPFNGPTEAVGCPVWSFTTEDIPPAPDCATDPNPADGAIDVPIVLGNTVTLSWTAPAGGETPTGYNIYAGETPAGNDYGLIATITGLTVDLNTDLYSTVLYWIVVPVNGPTEAVGCPVWSFTTEDAPPPPTNDDCANATVLTPGGVYADNPLDGTVIGATDDAEIATCGLTGPGVWYSILVPADGNITIEVGPDAGTGNVDFDSVIEAFSGVCGALSSIECDDDDAATNAFSILDLTGLDPGSIMYVRVWEYNGGDFQPFSISAYNATLGVDEVALENFTYYPNPVESTLTLKAQNEIQNVVVYNMLGQVVFRETPNTVENSLDMSSFQTGAYFVKVTVNDRTETIRVIKN